MFVPDFAVACISFASCYTRITQHGFSLYPTIGIQVHGIQVFSTSHGGNSLALTKLHVKTICPVLNLHELANFMLTC
jgi:hypothetical protein